MRSVQGSLKTRDLKRTSVESERQPSPQAAEEASKEEMNIVLRFLQEKNVPSWFRGGSRFQLEAVYSLFYAIRDDVEQSTTHRVRACLNGIGLYPIPPKEDLKLLMRLSRGDDLAFLWFLMEMHYKSSDTKYTISEQLILSAIAHLDMAATVHELDRILPPGNPSRKLLQRRENLAKEREKERLRTVNKPRKKCILPYFEPLQRKRPIVKPIVHMPDFKVKFKNLNDGVSHADNRWFTKYELSEGKRIVHRIISDEVDMLFRNTAKELENCKKKVLCSHHLEEENNKELELRIKEMEETLKCLKSLESGNSFNSKIKRKLLFEQFEKDLESYRKTLQKKAKLIEKQNQVNIIGKECFCHYLIDDDKNEEACFQPDIFICVNEQGEVERLSGGCDCENSRKQSNDIDHVLSTTRIISGKNGNDSQESIQASIPSLPASILRISRERFSLERSCRSTRFFKNVTPKSSEQFFKAQQEHKPSEFDYRKIFKFNYDHGQLKYKLLYLDALDCDKNGVKKLVDGTPDIMDAVNKCAMKTWREQLMIEKKTKSKQEELKKEKDDAMWKKNLEKYPNIPKQDWYDCEDMELMINMLREALKYMSKNRRFVLASIEDAWKLPLLREWISQRYGKRYSLKERIDLFRKSLKVVQAMNKFGVTVPTPKLSEIGNNLHLNYSYRECVAAKCKNIKDEFYNQLGDVIMEEARIFWFAMRPYICLNGPPRDTYFSYMPARVADIHNFRPWDKKQFMDAKSAWDKRQKQKHGKA